MDRQEPLFLYYYLGVAGVSVMRGIFLCCARTLVVSLRLQSELQSSHTSLVVVTCGILVLQPGIKPSSPALQCRFLTTGKSQQEPVLTVIPHLYISLSCNLPPLNFGSKFLCFTTLALSSPCFTTLSSSLPIHFLAMSILLFRCLAKLLDFRNILNFQILFLVL